MSAFAAKYARALADVVLEEKLDPREIERQLGDFDSAWRQGTDLREIFLDPAFPAEQKISILDKLNTRLQMSVQVRNFLAILIQHDRLGAFEEVLARYRREMDVRLGISVVKVITARKLDDDERHALETKVASMTGTEVRAAFEEDPALLGGAILRIGSTVYDGSVRGRLDRLKTQLVN